MMHKNYPYPQSLELDNHNKIHLLDICQRVRLTQLTAAPAVHDSGATASCSQPLIGPVLRWPGGRLLCLWPLPPQGHRSRKGATESARTSATPVLLHAACARARREPASAPVCLHFAGSFGSTQGRLNKAILEYVIFP